MLFFQRDQCCYNKESCVLIFRISSLFNRVCFPASLSRHTLLSDAHPDISLSSSPSNMANALANAMCERCKSGFAPAEKIVNSNGELYHEQCFVCAQCFQQFPEGLFYEVTLCLVCLSSHNAREDEWIGIRSDWKNNADHSHFFCGLAAKVIWLLKYLMLDSCDLNEWLYFGYNDAEVKRKGWTEKITTCSHKRRRLKSKTLLVHYAG